MFVRIIIIDCRSTIEIWMRGVLSRRLIFRFPKSKEYRGTSDFVFASSLALTSLSSSSTMSLEPIVPETRVLAIASHVGTPLHNHSSGAYG